MNVLSQFTSEGGWPGLDGFGLPKGVYAAGRLDRDSEGLLLLTDDGRQQARISSPKTGTEKTYLALVEGVPTDLDISKLTRGQKLKDGMAKAAWAKACAAPDWLWEREPPVRVRKSIQDSWLELALTEGRNRQVRRMCAAIGFPVLRLIRTQIGPHVLDGLVPGEWRKIKG